jgi:hypothetical protein
VNHFRIQRVISPEQANEKVGSMVTDQPYALPIQQEGIWSDVDTGEPVLAYAPLPGDVATFRRAVMDTPWSSTLRSGQGLRNVSSTFGMAPRKAVLKRESCRPSALYYTRPDIEAVLEDTANDLTAWVQTHLPDIAAADRKEVADVLPEWRLGEETIWTSGVINLSSQLPYHRDGANFHSWSAMPVVRRGVRGGELHLPEYDCSFTCRDGWVVYFPGWRIVHGVTPMTKVTEDGYRISVVYYSLKGMKDCHTWAVEQKRGTEKRTEREDHMLRDSPMDPVF